MIEIFKTSIETIQEAEAIRNNLLDRFPEYQINFDLDDCDRILKVVGLHIDPTSIIQLVTDEKHSCEILK